MADINKIFLKKQRDTNVSDYVGSQGEIFYDTTQRVLKISDGTTQGGQDLKIGNLYTSGNRIGIGDDSPTVVLSIKDTTPKIKFIDSDATGTPETLLDGSGGDLILDVDKDNEKGSTLFAVKIDGDEKLRITENGNIGINGLAPGASDETVAIQEPSGGAVAAATLSHLSGGNRYGCKLETISGANQGVVISNRYNSSYTERLRITTGGFVGIGVTNPDLRLHVNGVNGLPATSGSSPTGHLTLRAKAQNASHGMFMGVSNVAPWGSWIQAADANNLATEYPLLLNPNGGKIGIGTNGTTAGVVEVYNETSKINTLTLRTGAGASGYSGLAFASNGLHGREKAAIYFQETNGGAHFTGDLVFALNSSAGDASQVSTSDQKFRIGSAGQWGIGGANYGSSGQVLTSAGSGAAPTWATPSSGAVVAVHSIENGTKTNIDNSGNAQTITWGTFTKTRTDTKLVYNGLLHTFCDASNDSDATGLFISFESSSVSQVKKRHVCRIDVTGVNYRERPISVTGSISASDTNAAETYTVKWGSDTNSSDIGEWWNPNTSNDARFNAQRESVLIIWEVMP